MRLKRLSFLSIVLTLNATLALSQEFQNSDLRITKLQEKVWVIETADNASMYLIEGSKRALLIDTGTDCDSLDVIIQ